MINIIATITQQQQLLAIKCLPSLIKCSARFLEISLNHGNRSIELVKSLSSSIILVGSEEAGWPTISEQ